MIFFSWNVRGLTDPSCKYTIQDEITDVNLQFGSVDFVCLEEVKITYFLLQCTYKFLWQSGSFFHTNHVNGSGGVVTFISPKW